MRGLTKKIASAVLSLTLVFAVATTCSAATWGTYFGQNSGDGWGATGALIKNSDSAFTAAIETFGWEGVWGAQVFKKVSLKKGVKYHISFTAQSSKVTKWIYVKVSKGENLATSFWVQLPAGNTKKISKTFVAKNDATDVYFGLDADMGDRSDVTTDADAKIRYQVFGPNYEADLAQSESEVIGTATQIAISNFTITKQPGKVSLKSVKSKARKKVTVKYKKVKGAAGYQVQVGSKKKTTTKTTLTVSGLKSGKKVSVKVRAYTKGKKMYGAWSKTKKVKVK